MPTIEQRYQAATQYVRRAMVTVEARGILYTTDPTTGVIEWYAGTTKTTEPRAELARIEARWRQAPSEVDRAVVARDAELLADRVEENLPGAPQDRARTNLFKGETATSAPDTSYAREVERLARENTTDLSRWLSDRAESAEHRASSIGRWLLVAGGIVLAWKGFEYLRAREDAKKIERALNDSLARAAGARDLESAPNLRRRSSA